MNMKLRSLAICFLLISLLLVGCGQGKLFSPTQTPTPIPTPIPQVENETWHIQVVSAQVNELKNLTLLPGFYVLAVEIKIVNKTTENQTVGFFRIGISPTTTLDDCSFKVEGSNFCLPIGMGYRDENLFYTNDINDVLKFSNGFSVSPNAPDGEKMILYIGLRQGAKPSTFIFYNLPPIDISSLMHD